MPSTQYIEENEVTLPAILDLFLNSHHEAEIDREGRLIVLTEMALVGIDVLRCSVSCDHIPRRSWALFRARDVMRGVIESFKAEQAA